MMARAEIEVFGMVQGVGYRRFAEKRALEIGLTGIVRNEQGGQVHLDVEGDKQRIEDFITMLRSGPTFSRVSEVRVRWFEYAGLYDEFRITF